MPTSTEAPLSLETTAADLVRKLGGTWRPQGAMCRCPAHADRSPSLSVRIGATSLLFKCFAGCTGAEVLRAIRRLDLKVPVSGRLESAGGREVVDRSGSLARALWEGAIPLSASRGAAYLAGRAIPTLSPALRFHPRTPLGRGRLVRFRPAIIAAITERDVVAVQRLFLAPGLSSLATDLPNPRLTLGRPGTGAVRLQPPCRVLGLAEGVETAMSASILLGVPVWATLGNGRLPRIAIPPQVEQLILLPDNDAAGRLAEVLARQTYAADARVIETLWPWRGLNDWNDVLRAGGKGVGGRVRQTA